MQKGKTGNDERAKDNVTVYVCVKLGNVIDKVVFPRLV